MGVAEWEFDIQICVEREGGGGKRTLAFKYTYERLFL